MTVLFYVLDYPPWKTTRRVQFFTGRGKKKGSDLERDEIISLAMN